MKSNTRTIHRSVASGFTVVELLVTMSIVVLVTGIVMIRYSSFNSSVLLTSQAYLTAFDIREAQSLAVSVRGRSSEFREEYGVYFSMATPNIYQIFQDNDANGDHNPVRYNPGEEIGAPYTIDPRFVIVNLCASNGASRTCYADDPESATEVIDPTLNNITISFQRPDFDAEIYSTARTGLRSAEIVFGNPDSPIRKKVSVFSSGQLVVD